MSANNKRKRFLIIGVATLILAFLAISVVRSINKYIDTHTWATIHVFCKSSSDVTETFDYEHEYLKGDTITLGNVKLDITDITTDGTVTFSVYQGELYDENGEVIDADTIYKDTKSNYKLNNGVVSLTVTIGINNFLLS